jgi:uncharacterized Zn finger protein (UPF0148 family)
MHCPYCSSQLVAAANGELSCLSSGALFSSSVRNQIELLAAGNFVSSAPLVTFKLGRLFCPSCGSEMTNSACSNCGVVMSAKLVHELVELNPHVGT